MPGYVEDGVLARCQFGTTPSPVHTTDQIPFAAASDFVPFKNIHPFGVCSCPRNPTVAAATAAAMGKLTPMPCVPAISQPWQASQARIWVRGVRALDPHSTVCCRWGGLIQLINPGRR